MKRISEAERINTAIDDALNWLNRGSDGRAHKSRLAAAIYMIDCIRHDDGSRAFHWVRSTDSHILVSPVKDPDCFSVAERRDGRFVKTWYWCEM